jgi:hypothetical protein
MHGFNMVFCGPYQYSQITEIDRQGLIDAFNKGKDYIELANTLRIKVLEVS